MQVLLLCLMFFQDGHGHDHSHHGHDHGIPDDLPQESESKSEEEEKLQMERVAYFLGNELGKSLLDDEVEIDVEMIIKGLRDGLKGENSMPDVDKNAVMGDFRRAIMTHRRGKAQREAEKHRKLGRDFLTENAKREEVFTSDNGIQYRVIKAGDGPQPTQNDKVKVHYRGTLIDGTEFDSSYKRGTPASFSLRAVVRGWREAIPMMPVGSKWEIFLPADMAYGSRGSGRKIPPHSTLIFEIELLGIEGPPKVTQ